MTSTLFRTPVCLAGALVLLSVGQLLFEGGRAALDTGPPVVAAGASVHWIQTGETLSEIAQRHNVALDALLATGGNPERFPDPHRVLPGQRVELPRAAATVASPATPAGVRPPLTLQLLLTGLALVLVAALLVRWWMKEDEWPRAIALGLPSAALALILLWAAWYLALPCGPRGCDLNGTLQETGKRTWIHDRSGEPLGLLERDRGPWISLDAFPPDVVNAVLQREDRRFWTHRGVDPVGALRAVFSLRRGRPTQGASTIAMQAARCAVGEFGSGRLPAAGTLRGKLAEVSAGAALVRTIGREGTLELYLNCVPMGPVNGLDAAARFHFGRDIGDVSLAEALTLAGIIRAPSALSPSAHPDRARGVRLAFYRTLVDRGKVDPTLVPEEAMRAPIRRTGARRTPYSDAVMAVRRELDGAESVPDPVTSTLDAGLQAEAWRQLEGLLQGMARQSGKAANAQAVFLALTSDGKVRAYVAGRPGGSGLGYDRIQLARIPLASTLKPLLLAGAMEAGRMQPADTLAALPCDEADDPLNDWVWKMRVRAHDTLDVSAALARSDNWLAVCALRLIPAREAARLRKAGVPIPNGGAPAEALGTNVIRPIELASLYSSFLNGGERPSWTLLEEDRSGDAEAEEPRSFVRRIPILGTLMGWLFDRHQELLNRGEAPLWSPSTTTAIRSALTAVVEEGTGRAARNGRPEGVTYGVKTGTTTDAHGRVLEMLVVGFREGPGEDLVGLLWVGRDEPAPLGLSGSAGRHLVPTWAAIMRHMDAPGEGR